VLVIIILNTIAMAMYTDNMTPEWTHALDSVSLGFTAFYCLEVVLKLTGLGFTGYFRDVWHVFDFIVTIAAIVSSTFPRCAPSSAD
jgi:hypothetical protein